MVLASRLPGWQVEKGTRYIEHENGCLTAMLPGKRKVFFGESDWRKVKP